MLAGQCPYLSGKGSSRFINLPANPMDLEKEICGKIHREGILCGKCELNYGPAVNLESFDCLKCGDEVYYNWVFYLLTEFRLLYFFL